MEEFFRVTLSDLEAYVFALHGTPASPRDRKRRRVSRSFAIPFREGYAWEVEFYRGPEVGMEFRHHLRREGWPGRLTIGAIGPSDDTPMLRWKEARLMADGRSIAILPLLARRWPRSRRTTTSRPSGPR